MEQKPAPGSLVNMPDNIREAVKELKEGNIHFLKVIYEEYKKRVYNVAYRYTGSRSDAEEVVQDVFVKVYDRIGQLKNEELIHIWIYRIAVNLSIDCINKRKRFFSFMDYFAVPGKKDDFTDRVDTKELVAGLLKKLKPAYRTVVILRFNEDLKYEEIAQVLNISIGTVKSRLSRALEILKKEYMETVK